MTGPEPLAITAGWVTCRMRHIGWADFVRIPRELDAITSMQVETSEDIAALEAAMTAWLERVRPYVVEGDPGLIPFAEMTGFVGRWVAGVRDAAVPPTSAGASPASRSSTRRAKGS